MKALFPCLLLALLWGCSEPARQDKPAAPPARPATPGMPSSGVIFGPGCPPALAQDPQGPVAVVARFYNWYVDSVAGPIMSAETPVSFSASIDSVGPERYRVTGAAYLRRMRRLGFFTDRCIDNERRKIATCDAYVRPRRYDDTGVIVNATEPCVFLYYDNWLRTQEIGLLIRVDSVAIAADRALVFLDQYYALRENPEPPDPRIKVTVVRTPAGWRIDEVETWDKSTPEQTGQAVEVGEATAARDSMAVAQVPDSVEKRIGHLLEALPEFQRANRRIDSLSNHQHGAAWMVEAASPDHPYYLVRVGANLPERFMTSYLFRVDPKTYELKVEDVAADEGEEAIVPLDVWRKRQARRARATL